MASAPAIGASHATRNFTRPLSTIPLPQRLDHRLHSSRPFNQQYYAVDMSSPTKRRSQRSSATPRRSTRNTQIPSSPAPGGPEDQIHSEASHASQRGLNATPRHSRLQETASQSPLFFRSSPVTASGSGAGNDALDSDGGATPKASAMNIGGKSMCLTLARDYTNNKRFLSYSISVQQPGSSSPGSKHRYSKQQQRTFCPWPGRYSSS